MARTCAAWRALVADGFAYWLRWRVRATPRELRAGRCAPLEDVYARHQEMLRVHGDVFIPAARVARGVGCLDWLDAAGSELVVCCAERSMCVKVKSDHFQHVQ